MRASSARRDDGDERNLLRRVREQRARAPLVVNQAGKRAGSLISAERVSDSRDEPALREQRHRHDCHRQVRDCKRHLEQRYKSGANELKCLW